MSDADAAAAAVHASSLTNEADRAIHSFLSDLYRKSGKPVNPDPPSTLFSVPDRIRTVVNSNTMHVDRLAIFKVGPHQKHPYF